ncbi:MAG: glycoside hydrolase family 5 protein [Acidobacteria bacterium]|nr:glycoside hydrolase family 5 protein [Acidobacteriota bacterium]MBA4185438.1 glycoside hydrolase family 5 protein [Acidobacteriota bacterium]
MKIKLILVLILFLCFVPAQAQSVAQKRAGRMEAGMNLSYLDNYWLGTKEKKFADFVKVSDVAKREKMFADIAKAGFKTVRIPINFGAWASLKPPYEWENKEGPEAADLFVKWALANDLNVIIDLHHTELDNSIPGAATTERIVSLWKRIAERYKNTDREKVFFELRNEPHDISAADWRAQAEQLIKTVRAVAPNHTLIVGFHDWNSRQALIDSKPFPDTNIIYTFHYYDPFIFTHQGATWSSEGLPELKNVPFPWSKDAKIQTPPIAKGKWIENQINSYQKDSAGEKMFADLKAAKEWAEKNKVPIFLGEFGSFNKYAALDARCRHAEIIYSSLGKLNIPSAWWEWDGGFNMFEPGTTKIADCMRKAIESYAAQKPVE